MAALAGAKIAPVKWAQRKDSLYITIDLRDVKDEKINLEPEKLSFTGTAGGDEYTLELDFLHAVKPDDEQSIVKVLPRSVQMHIMKEAQDEDFWERLLKDKKLEKTNVKIDWDKYVDEDEETDGFDMSNLDGGAGFGGMGGGAGGMDMAQMQQMMAQMGGGGMGGMPGMDGMGDFGGEEDSDDEDLPDLDGDGEGAGGGEEPEELD